MPNSQLTIEQEAKQLWKAALEGWDVEKGDMEVDFQQFHTFLLPFYKSRNARDDRMKVMRMHGYIDFPDGNPGRGNKKTVRVFSTPGQTSDINKGDVSWNLSQVARPATT